MPTLKENIIEILLKSKQINKEQLEKALVMQKKKQVSLRKILVDQGVISEDDLLEILSQHLYIPTLRLSKYKFDPKITQLIPERLLYRVWQIP
jgi:hypothetical protein